MKTRYFTISFLVIFAAFAFLPAMLKAAGDNDECSSAMDILNNSKTFFSSHLSKATKSSDPWPPCADPPGTVVDVWYRINPNVSQLVTINLDVDLADSGIIVYSGTCNDLELVDCAEVDEKELTASLQFVTDIHEMKDYYIRLYGYSVMGGYMEVTWEPTMQGNVCENPLPVCCDEVYDIDNPIPGRGEDVMPCMEGLSYPIASQWLEITVYPGTYVEVSVYDWDLGQMVGIGFYDSCDDVSDPLYSTCAEDYVSMAYANPDPMGDPETIKILVNFCSWCMQPNVSLSCEETQYGQFCTGGQPAQCETVFNTSNPIEAAGNDLLPCMEGYQGLYSGRWIDFTIPMETIVNIAVDGYNPTDIVGAGFYETCGDLSSPLNSSCGEGSVLFAWDNPSQEPLNIKILVNSPYMSPHPEISFFCMPYH